MYRIFYRIIVGSLLCINPVFADYMLTQTTTGAFLLLDEQEKPVVKIHLLAFGPEWKWMGFSQLSAKENAQGTRYVYQLNKGEVLWDIEIKTQGNDTVINSKLYAPTTVPLTYLSLNVVPEVALQQGRIDVTDAHGHVSQLPIPFTLKNSKNIVSMDFLDEKSQSRLHAHFTTAVDIHHDRSSRIILADKALLSQQARHHQIILSTPKKITFYPSLKDMPDNNEHRGWFAFSPRDHHHNSETSMQGWLKPGHPPWQINGAAIESRRTPVKVWGTNVEFAAVAPTQEQARQRTQFFVKHGINSVRLHKLTNPGWEGLGTTRSASDYDKEKLSRFDYWLSLLNNNGISYGFSPIWDLMVFSGDRDQLIAYDEIVQANPEKPVTTGLVWFAKDVQDLHIQTLTHLLNHKNPYTQQRYADDPALRYIEIQNEENVFFYSFIANVAKYPTYHQLLAQQFSEWLRHKYRTHERLVHAWGSRAINTFNQEGGLPGEHLDKRNITPVTNPWFHDHQAMKGHRAKRLQDTARFLLEQQQNFYARATKAIRDTGFTGFIVAGNWQAGQTGAHFLNLLSDAEVGIVDRHNYQGGAKGSPGHTMKSGMKLLNRSMLGNPGSGLLSTGMQQVSQRPFMVSEWLSVVPMEWAAADTVIMAAYGFGLQGWDMSYHFASNGNGFSSQLTYPSDKKFNNLTPVGIGLYPVLSRMVLRGDISEAKPIAIRRLSQEQAVTNTYDFENTLKQQEDVKSLSGSPHHHALAAGKVLIEFTAGNKGVSTIDNWRNRYERTNNDQSKTIRSSTGQLAWTYWDTSTAASDHNGFVEINSRGTQGIVGFAPNNTYQFHDIRIQPHSTYSVILVTAKSPDGTLQSDREAIVIAIARAHNTNMNIKGSLIVNAGTSPVILEPVKATLHFARNATIVVLDHDGMATETTYALTDGKFELDTQRDNTIYYLVRFASDEPL